MHFTKKLSTLVTIATFSALLVGALSAEVGLAAANNNGLNLQTGGNGQGNNGCGNGNGGPSGTKDCAKNEKDGLSDFKDGSSDDEKLGLGSGLSDSEFEKIASGSDGDSKKDSESDSKKNSEGDSKKDSEGDSKKGSDGDSKKGSDGDSKKGSDGDSKKGSDGEIRKETPSGGLNAGTSTVPSGTTFTKVPAPTALPGVLILGACGVATRLRKRA